MQVNSTTGRMFRVQAVAEILDVHRSTVYRLAESGQLRSVRIGFGKGALRIPADSLNEYLRNLGLSPINDEQEGGAIA